MELAPRHGHGRALYQLRAGHVLQLIKAMNARIVDNAGIETQKILHMVNTSSPRRAANCRASICPIDKSLKRQATSSKPQAASRKQRWASPTPGGGGEKAPATICHIDTKCRGATKRVYKNVMIHGTISF